VAQDAREHFGDKVFTTIIPRNIRLAEAPSFGKPIVVYDALSVGAQSYMAVAKELITRMAAGPSESASAMKAGSTSTSPEQNPV